MFLDAIIRQVFEHPLIRDLVARLERIEKALGVDGRAADSTD